MFIFFVKGLGWQITGLVSDVTVRLCCACECQATGLEVYLLAEIFLNNFLLFMYFNNVYAYEPNIFIIIGIGFSFINWYS